MAFRNRFAALAVLLLALALFALSAIAGTEGAAAARYVVAQCGWHVGQDAKWFDSTSGRFGKSSYCQTPASADPFEGVHLINELKGSTKSVGGTEFSSWRWQAPNGTGIVNIHGQRWQYLREGFQHRLGGVPPNGKFTPFLELDTSDGTKRDFWQGFSPYAQAFETRLVCYRTQDRNCLANGTILTGVRSLTISLDDSVKPTAAISGPLTGAGWLRGSQALSFSNKDTGAGLRFAQTSIDGALRASTEMNCAKAMISGQWRGTKLQPCPTAATGTQSVDTRVLSDGSHTLRHCAIDFAGSQTCAPDRTIRVDNNPPAAPRQLEVEGGDGWRRTNGFNLTWSDPPQGAGSPILASAFRVSGSEHRGGPWVRTGSGRLDGIQVPGPGEYRVKLWLADLAGNSSESNSAEVTLRLDDVPPTGYFEEPPADDPALIRVPVADRFSGIYGGSISLRSESGGQWREIPTRLTGLGEQQLSARFPDDLPRGTWLLRAVVVDRAGNVTVVDRRANGSVMSVKAPLREETSISIVLASGLRDGSAAEVGYGEKARLTGRLTGTERGGIGDAEVTVTETPFPGSKGSVVTRAARTDERGYFEVWLSRGPSRRVSVQFAGTKRLDESNSGVVELKVKGRLTFRAKPRRLRTGRKVFFRGRVMAQGAWHPVRGNLIQVQYFEESARRWRPVALTRTDRHGRYRTSYRFRYITGVARIRLRALLVPASRFPYSGAASKPVKIRVRG